MKQKPSLIISTILVEVFFLVLVSTLFVIPYIAEWYDAVSGEAPVAVFLMVTLYLCSIAGFALIINLYLLLKNIRNEKIFVDKNVQHLRFISYSLFSVALILSVFGILRRPFTFSFVFVFLLLGVVMRVLQNVFEAAVNLQTEADFTI